LLIFDDYNLNILDNAIITTTIDHKASLKYIIISTIASELGKKSNYSMSIIDIFGGQN